MSHDEMLKVFEDTYVEGRTMLLNDALADCAGWIAEQWARLDENEISVLMVVGGAMFKAGMAKRVAAALE